MRQYIILIQQQRLIPSVRMTQVILGISFELNISTSNCVFKPRFLLSLNGALTVSSCVTPPATFSLYRQWNSCNTSQKANFYPKENLESVKVQKQIKLHQFQMDIWLDGELQSGDDITCRLTDLQFPGVDEPQNEQNSSQ